MLYLTQFFYKLHRFFASLRCQTKQVSSQDGKNKTLTNALKSLFQSAGVSLYHETQ